MANPNRLTNKLLVCPQLQVEDLAALNAVGIRSIICNRPDNEGPDQPTAQSIADAAKQLGMTLTALPVTSKLEVSPEAVTQFGELVEAADGEVVAYCKTGKRSAVMWALSQRGKRPVKEILQATAQSGFDLSGIADQLMTDARSSTASPSAVAEKKKSFWSRLFGR